MIGSVDAEGIARLAATAASAVASGRSAPLRVSIFGATGHVGRAAIDLIAAAPHAYRLVAISSNYEVGRLDALIDKVVPEIAIAADGEAFIHLRDMLRRRPIEIGAGDRAMVTAAARPADFVVMAVPGLAGLPLAFAAAAAGAVVAIADPRVAAMAAGLLSAGEAEPRTLLLGGPAAAAIDLIDSGFAIDAVDLVVGDSETDGFSMALQLMALAGLRSFAADAIGFRRGSTSGAIGLAAGRATGWRPVASSNHQALAYAIIAATTGRPAAAALSGPQAPLSERVDEPSVPMLHLARRLIRTGRLAPVAMCAAYDVAVGALETDGAGVHDVAAVVTETVDSCVRVIDAGGRPDLASLERTDMAARAMAYDLLDRIG